MKTSSKLIVVGLVLMVIAIALYLRGTAPDSAGAYVWRSSGKVELNLVKRMESACEASYGVINGQLEDKCGAMVDSLQCRGFEVFSKGGDFWAEVNKKMRC